MNPTATELDLRALSPSELADRAFERFESLSEDGSFTLISHTDPRAAYERLRRDRADRLGWAPLVNGPDEWRIVITKLRPKEKEEELGAYLGRDHDELDVIFAYLKQDLRAALKQAGTPVEAIVREFAEFDARLERHMRWEDEILFPAVEERKPELKRDSERVMRSEHEQIRRFKGIAAKHLRGTPSQAALSRALETLEEVHRMLLDHNHKEESTYYPTTDRVFTRPEMANLLARIRRMH